MKKSKEILNRIRDLFVQLEEANFRFNDRDSLKGAREARVAASKIVRELKEYRKNIQEEKHIIEINRKNNKNIKK